ncbi:MAG: ParB N-terminal domain-containing protein [Chloroflexi bacterium]|nr:ParB N-terminal domain-containing protein [Chloroflexota bacterium]
MDIVEILISQIEASQWNSNEMNDSERRRLVASMERFELVQPVVVRKLAPCRYETISGAQRLAVMLERGFPHVPCVVVQADDASARLLSQALNHIHGHENDGLRAEQFREIIDSFGEGDLIELLPETVQSIGDLLSLGSGDLGEYMRDWDEKQSARLRHRTFQLTDPQVEVVIQAIRQAASILEDVGDVTAGDEPVNPNEAGNALYLICQDYLNQASAPIDARYMGKRR